MGKRLTVTFGELVSALYETFLEELGDEKQAAEAVVEALGRLFEVPTWPAADEAVA